MAPIRIGSSAKVRSIDEALSPRAQQLEFLTVLAVLGIHCCELFTELVNGVALSWQLFWLLLGF